MSFFLSSLANIKCFTCGLSFSMKNLLNKFSLLSPKLGIGLSINSQEIIFNSTSFLYFSISSQVSHLTRL